MTETTPDRLAGPLEVAAKCPHCGQWISANVPAHSHAESEAVAKAALKSHEYICPKKEQRK